MRAGILNHEPWRSADAAQRTRAVVWTIVSVLAALLGYFGFRAYLNPELLFQFANSFHC